MNALFLFNESDYGMESFTALQSATAFDLIKTVSHHPSAVRILLIVRKINKIRSGMVGGRKKRMDLFLHERPCQAVHGNHIAAPKCQGATVAVMAKAFVKQGTLYRSPWSMHRNLHLDKAYCSICRFLRVVFTQCCLGCP